MDCSKEGTTIKCSQWEVGEKHIRLGPGSTEHIELDDDTSLSFADNLGPNYINSKRKPSAGNCMISIVSKTMGKKLKLSDNCKNHNLLPEAQPLDMVRVQPFAESAKQCILDGPCSAGRSLSISKNGNIMSTHGQTVQPPQSSSNLRVPFLSYEHQFPYADALSYENDVNQTLLRKNEQLSLEIWSQELPKPRNFSGMKELASTHSRCASEAELYMQGMMRKLDLELSHACMDEELDADLQPADCHESDGLNASSICLGSGGFSFQRLINGDITGFEHEFEGDSDADNEKVEVAEEANEGEDNDMYLNTCTSPQIQDHGLEPCVYIPDSKDEQQSDDMYHVRNGSSKHSTFEHEDLEVYRVNLSDDNDESACCNGPQEVHGSPCLHSYGGAAQQPSSLDFPRDLISKGYGSPCMHQSMKSCWPTSAAATRDLTKECTSPSMRKLEVYGSPCLHPVIDMGSQTSACFSRSTSLRPRVLDSTFGSYSCQGETGAVVSLSPPQTATPCKDLVIDHLSGMEVHTAPETPWTVKGLLSFGFMQGLPVTYKGGGVMLTGIVKNGGILCNCRACKGKTVVNISCFEKHAGSTLRHPSENILLENGQSLLEILKTGWQASNKEFASGVCNSLRNNGTNEDVTKEPTCTPGALNHHKQPFNSNISRAGQAPPPSQTRDVNKLLFLPGGLPDGIEVAYYFKGQRILTGAKMGNGICCTCCHEVISCSSFEAHAGWGSRRNPYSNIFLSDGQSLQKYAQSLAAKMRVAKCVGDNDDLCAECGDGGDLVLCDACPGAYHIECLGIATIPEGDWFCPLCEEKNEHSRKVDLRSSQTYGQLPNSALQRKALGRCQRIVKVSKNSVGGCVICKSGDFLKSGFGTKTTLLCDQCEREYHVGCLKEKGIADLKELPAGEWFCGAECNRIRMVLQELVSSGPKPVCSHICKRVLEKKQKEGQEEHNHQDSEFTWQLLHGRRGDPENGKVLSEAASIFMESFDPIVDAMSRRDLISLMVHSRSSRDQDFGGMHCMVLKCKQKVVSAAIIRIFGRQFAELPLVATSTLYRRQGYFQMLMLSIEHVLGMLRVESLVLPATEDAEKIWINQFGFTKLQDERVQQLESEVQLMLFQGSSMLLKSVSHQSCECDMAMLRGLQSYGGQTPIRAYCTVLFPLY